MTRTIRAHFDGKTIVPDEPLDLPAGQALSVTVEPVNGEASPSVDRPIGEVLTDFARRQPRADDDGQPDDLAAQHDHYLYGTPKRP